MARADYEAYGLRRLRKWSPHIGEILLMVGGYFAYMYTRKLVYSDFESTALENAQRVVELEKSLGFFWEPVWQTWAIESARSLVVFFNWAYIITFLPMVMVIAIVLYVTDRKRYLYYRTVVLITFGVALLGYMVFPLAPPHMLAGYFVDTIKVFGPTAYASGTTANYYNAYAAMPSLHFAWTVVLGIMLLRTNSKPLKVLGVLYPTITLFAIIITGNHYILDATGGAVVMIGSFAMMEVGLRRRLFLPQVLARFRAVFRERQARLPWTATSRNSLTSKAPFGSQTLGQPLANRSKPSSPGPPGPTH